MPRQLMSLNESLYDYYQQRSARYADSTWRAHERQLELFREWVSKPSELGANCLLVDVDERVMVRYFNRLRPPILSGSAFNNYRQYLKQFWKFCLEEAWVPRDPMRHVDPAPVVRRPRLQLSAQELLQCLVGASPRDRVGLALGMHTGLRANDITALKVGNVNLSNNTLHAFIKKTQKYDDLPITSELREELIQWFRHYAQVQGLSDWQRDLPLDWTLVPPAHFEAFNVWKPEDGGVVRYKTGRPYSNPEKIVQRALQRLGYPTRQEGFHTLRRSSARGIYDLANDEGIADPIRMAQALLGHKNRETTEVYLGLTIEKEMRNELLRGKSFLRRRADAEVANATGHTPGRTAEPARLDRLVVEN